MALLRPSEAVGNSFLHCAFLGIFALLIYIAVGRLTSTPCVFRFLDGSDSAESGLIYTAFCLRVVVSPLDIIIITYLIKFVKRFLKNIRNYFSMEFATSHLYRVLHLLSVAFCFPLHSDPVLLSEWTSFCSPINSLDLLSLLPLDVFIITQGRYFVKGILGFFIRHFIQKLAEKIMLNCAFCPNQDRLRRLCRFTTLAW